MYALLAKIVGPLGSVLSIYLYFSPMGVVNTRRRLLDQGIGEINPFQLCLGLSATQLWTVYGILKRDIWLCGCAMIGIILNMYYLVSAMGLLGIAYGKSMSTMPSFSSDSTDGHISQLKKAQIGVVSVISFWGLLYLWLFFREDLTRVQVAQFIGTICSIQYYVYYCRYIPQLVNMVKTKDSSSIIPHLLVADILCCFCWLTYGFVVNDTNLIYPNVLGLAYGITYVVLFFMWREGSGSGKSKLVTSRFAQGERQKQDAGGMETGTFQVLSTIDDSLGLRSSSDIVNSSTKDINIGIGIGDLNDIVNRGDRSMSVARDRSTSRLDDGIYAFSPS